MNTMADLRRECARRLRETLHGKEVDMFGNDVELAHMLGIVPIGTITTNTVEEGTILDHSHEFWQDFQEDVNTKNAVENHIETAIRSLKKDDIFRMTYPYGEEADIAYCEVEEMDDTGEVLLPTTCGECGNTIEVPLSLNHSESFDGRHNYTLDLHIDCPHCEFSRKVTTNPMRQ